MVAPGPSVGAFRAAAAAAGAFLAEALPSAAEEAAAALRPCPGVGRTSLVLLRGRAPSLMLGASRARLVPSRAPAGYSGGGGARAAARALRWRLCAAASRRVASQGRPDHLSSRGAAALLLHGAASWLESEGCGQSSKRFIRLRTRVKLAPRTNRGVPETSVLIR